MEGRPTRLARVGQGFAVLVGVWSGLAGLRSGDWLFLALFLASVAILLGWVLFGALRRPGPTPLPDPEDVLEPEVRAAPVTVVCPVGRPLLGRIVELERSLFAGEAVPARVMEAWYDENPLVFVALVDEVGSLLGYFDLLPLREEALRRLVHGEMRESDLVAADVLKGPEARAVRTAYLSSVAVADVASFAGKRHVGSLLQGLERFLREGYASLEAIYAIAATPEGARLCRRLGGEVAASGEGRRDGHDLWRIPLQGGRATLRLRPSLSDAPPRFRFDLPAPGPGPAASATAPG